MSNLKFEQPGDLREAVEKYFTECDLIGRPKTMSGLALALGTNRMTLYNYEVGRRPGDAGEVMKNDFHEIMQWAKAVCENYAEEKLFTKDKGQAGIIFSLKNNYKWQDKHEMSVPEGLIIRTVTYQEQAKEIKQEDGDNQP